PSPPQPTTKQAPAAQQRQRRKAAKIVTKQAQPSDMRFMEGIHHKERMIRPEKASSVYSISSGKGRLTQANEGGTGFAGRRRPNARPPAPASCSSTGWNRFTQPEGVVESPAL
ncbi:MAG: hypothetical protein ACK53L_32950, partial [Pirellulaceae bacterium]